MKTIDEEEKCGFYGISDHNASARQFGTCTEACERIIVKLEGFDSSRVLDFACGKRSTMIIMKGNEEAEKSIIPNEPGAKGLVHVYKQDDEWKYISE